MALYLHAHQSSKGQLAKHVVQSARVRRKLRHRNTAAKTAIGMSAGDMEYSANRLESRISL